MSEYSRFTKWIRKVLGRSAGSPQDLEVTAELPMPSSVTLVPGVLRLIVGVVSTVGNVREQNEDNYYVPGKNPVRPNIRTEGSGEIPASVFEPEHVFIVADGMGGQQAGEHASLMAVEIIPKAIARRLKPGETEDNEVQGAIREAVAEANQEILGCSGAAPEYANMGTTVVLALFRHDRAYIAGIGDSRAYRLREGQFEQLTKDHSLADALYEAGTITKEEMPNHKYKNVLYLYLGSKDARSGPDEVRVLDLRPGDRFLLASDGLTGVVSDHELAEVLGTCDDPQRAAQILKDRALTNESKDNVTNLVIHVVSEAAGGASSGFKSGAAR